MRLNVLLPFEVFADEPDVSRVVAETHEGSFGLLPRRLDCVAALAPGILVYETRAFGEAYLAIDEGVLVKTGAHLQVVARRALRGSQLDELRAIVERQWQVIDERQRSVREVMTKLENRLLQGFARFSHE